MDAKTQEILDILQEECAEVIVEISKCRRFGLESVHHKTGLPHRDMLEQEIADVMALVDLLEQSGLISRPAIDECKQKKIKKLQKWSTIFQ